MWLPMRDRRVRPSAALVTARSRTYIDLAALACFFAVNLLWFEPPVGRETEFEYVETVGYALLAAVVLGFYRSCHIPTTFAAGHRMGRTHHR
jgi:hypothetical protein